MIKSMEMRVFSACAILLAILLAAFKGDTGTDNPHVGLTDKIISSWEHKGEQRFPQPLAIREAWSNMNYRSGFESNEDRPVTSKVSPVMVNPLSFGERSRFRMDTSKNPPEYMGSDEDLLGAHALLEEHQLEFFPTPTRRNGKNYKFNKLFNFDDVPQWRIHHPSMWIAEVNDVGRPSKLTSEEKLAEDLCLVGMDVHGRPYSWSKEDLNGDCVPSKVRFKPETYSIFMDYREDSGLAIGAHISQMNYTKSGHVRSTGANVVSIEEGTYPNERATISFNQRNGFIDFDDRYVDKNDSGERFLRVRHVSKEEGYGPIRYIKILTREQAGL